MADSLKQPYLRKGDKVWFCSPEYRGPHGVGGGSLRRHFRL